MFNFTFKKCSVFMLSFLSNHLIVLNMFIISALESFCFFMFCICLGDQFSFDFVLSWHILSVRVEAIAALRSGLILLIPRNIELLSAQKRSCLLKFILQLLIVNLEGIYFGENIAVLLRYDHQESVLHIPRD